MVEARPPHIVESLNATERPDQPLGRIEPAGLHLVGLPRDTRKRSVTKVDTLGNVERARRLY